MQYGEDAIKEGMGSGGGGGGGMGDIFDILSGGGGRRQQPRERRGENVVHRLKVSLEEMYSGGVRKLSLSRNIKCDTCGGSGTKSGKRYQCEVGFLPHSPYHLGSSQKIYGCSTSCQIHDCSRACIHGITVLCPVCLANPVCLGRYQFALFAVKECMVCIFAWCHPLQRKFGSVIMLLMLLPIAAIKLHPVKTDHWFPRRFAMGLEYK